MLHKFCYECGKKYEDEWKYCPNCGTQRGPTCTLTTSGSGTSTWIYPNILVGSYGGGYSGGTTTGPTS